MTQTAEGCGWVDMYVARTGTGYTIEFLNIDHGFGALTAATTFDSDDAPLLIGQSWVQPPNLEGKLLRFLRTTADLSWLRTSKTCRMMSMAHQLFGATRLCVQGVERARRWRHQKS